MGLAVKLQKKVSGFTLDVEWEIGNELAVIFGPSGSGKSMTLQLIAGLMPPDGGRISAEGKIFFDAEHNISLPPQQRRIGYVFQDLALFPHMSIEDNILYGAKGIEKSVRDKRLYDIISIFRLDGIEHKRPGEISGGQKQRVALARALIRKPDVLLLDEPFSSLDTSLRADMRTFLKDIRKEFNLPVILITHDIFEAITLADRVILYEDGKVIIAGKPHEVLNPEAMPECEFPLFFSYMLNRGFF